MPNFLPNRESFKSSIQHYYYYCYYLNYLYLSNRVKLRTKIITLRFSGLQLSNRDKYSCHNASHENTAKIIDILLLFSANNHERKSSGWLQNNSQNDSFLPSLCFRNKNLLSLLEKKRQRKQNKKKKRRNEFPRDSLGVAFLLLHLLLRIQGCVQGSALNSQYQSKLSRQPFKHRVAES